MHIVLLSLMVVLLLLHQAKAAFNATSHTNIIYYWGQNSASVAPQNPPGSLWQKRLSYYCDEDDKDIIVVSFLHQFGQGRQTAFDLANRSKDCKGVIPGTQLLDCPFMEEDIRYCQSKDKKIILSMGGATPAYGLATTKEGENLADELWDTFGGGYMRNGTAFRPFGNVTVDGFDLDIENGEKLGYTAFVNRMRENYKLDTTKEYYMAAAPQCPFPDYYVGDVLNNAWFDFVMIQFYNNFCNVINDGNFNYNTWNSWATSRSINKNVRLFVGIPGSPTAAGRGYVPYTQLVTKIQPLKSMDSFGGIMVWDASQAYGHTEDVLPNYAYGVSRLIKGANDSSPIELAPINMNTEATGTTIATTSYGAVETTLSPISSTSSIPAASLQTTPQCIVNNVTSYSTLQSVWTSTVSEANNNSSVSSSQSVESIYTSVTVLAYTTQATSCVTTAIGNTPTLSPQLPKPVEGQACEIDGALMCSGESSFAQCTFNQWILRNCTTGTICRDTYDTNPPSIYCGFP